MSKDSYLPHREADRVTWLNNLAAKISTYQTLFGLALATVNSIKADALFYAYIIGLQDQVKTFKETITSFKNTLSFAPTGTVLGTLPVFAPAAAPPIVAAGIFTREAAIIAGIKSQIAVYTTAIGEDLGIEGATPVFVPDDYKTTLTAKVVVDGVKITFVKAEAEGVHLYSRINGTGAFTFLATDTHSPYIDTRPLLVAGTPEKREYYAIGLLHDAEIGLHSDTVSVTVG